MVKAESSQGERPLRELFKGIRRRVRESLQRVEPYSESGGSFWDATMYTHPGPVGLPEHVIADLNATTPEQFDRARKIMAALDSHPGTVGSVDVGKLPPDERKEFV